VRRRRLSRPGEAYALHPPQGGTVEVRLAEGASCISAWWNPANGRAGEFAARGTVGGGEQTFTAPGPGDWALRIVRAAGAGVREKSR